MVVPLHETETATVSDLQELAQWLCGQLPASVLGNDPEVTIDADELLIILTLETEMFVDEGEATRRRAEQELVERLRSQTRQLRIQLGRHLERTYGCAVSWGMRAGETLELFTPNTAPVMTRLSRQERQVLDTLIAANIAHTRSAALSYIVRLFAAEHQEWLNTVQQAVQQMTSLREQLRPQQRGNPPPLDLSTDHSKPSL